MRQTRLYASAQTARALSLSAAVSNQNSIASALGLFYAEGSLHNFQWRNYTEKEETKWKYFHR